MTKSYRVNGQHEFTLDFERDSDGTYTIWARKWPKNSYSNDEIVTHVHPRTGKLCVSRGKEPRAMDTAIAIGQLWCKGYSIFMDTGEFPNGSARVNV